MSTGAEGRQRTVVPRAEGIHRARPSRAAQTLVLELEVCPLLAAVIEGEQQDATGPSPRLIGVPDIRVLIRAAVVLQRTRARACRCFDVGGAGESGAAYDL